jgi:release factor glutamine methyltransferase
MPDGAVHDALAAATTRLRAAGFAAADAATDVGVLARHLLGWDRAQLLARRLDRAPEGFAGALDALVARRLDRVPVAYLTGIREFYGLDFEVTPDVLIPRPETELAVEATLMALPMPLKPRPFARIVDVGTGSGAIAIAIAAGRADVRVLGIDRSRAALAVARRNVARHAVGGRVALVAGDLLSAVDPGAAVDVIVSNPPYVPEASPDVAADVRLHEPPLALYAGPDGLDVVRRLIAGAAAVLAPTGALIMEIGAGQADAVAALARDARQWEPARFRADLQGIPRLAVLARAAAQGR